MKFQPYPYQKQCLDAIAEARRTGRTRTLVIMASGLGKTVTAALDAKGWLEKHGGRLLYLCHQNFILEQACATFRAVLGESHTFGYYHGERKTSSKVTCLFASFQAMRERRREFTRGEFDYIVVDESHHGSAPTYRPTIEYFQPRFLLGITATPDRADLQDIRQIYGKEIFSLLLEEAIANGLLTPVDYYLMVDEIQNLEKLETTPGKLTISDLNVTLFIPRRDDEIVRIVRGYMGRLQNPRVMIFCQSVTHCDRFHRLLPDSYPVHYMLPRSTQRLHLEIFRRGDVNILLVIDKFNEGIDVPEANLVVFLRSTSSRTVFLQQLGRGLRKLPGKDRVVTLDFVANCERLQMVHELWKKVGSKARERNGVRVKEDEFESFKILDVASVNFSTEARHIVSVLAAIREGYTKEVLIQHLQKLAKKLGRTPTQQDVAKAASAGTCAHFVTFARAFGSFNTAVIKAGLPLTQYRGYTRELLVNELSTLAKELGRAPTEKDVAAANRKGKCGSPHTFWRVFGSFNDALAAANQPISHQPAYSEDRLIEQLRDLAKKLRRIPVWGDVRKTSKEGKCAHPMTFLRVFGSFSAALYAARPLGSRRIYRR